MIDLKEYREYWEALADRVEGLTGVLPVTVDEGMAKKIMSLPKGSVTLFILPPGASSIARNVDGYRESNDCVVFVMERYDPQRRTAFDALETSQRVIERVKEALILSASRSCSSIRPDVSTLNTLPETELFAGMAGWSIGFKVISE